MQFEYDPEKSSKNLEKHGIDFEAAQRLCNSPMLFIEAEARNDDSRFLVIGVIDGKNWTAVTTMRGANTRIISVRRSRDYEKEAYDERFGCQS